MDPAFRAMALQVTGVIAKDNSKVRGLPHKIGKSGQAA
jgi:hypothetical protein